MLLNIQQFVLISNMVVFLKNCFFHQHNYPFVSHAQQGGARPTLVLAESAKPVYCRR